MENVQDTAEVYQSLFPEIEEVWRLRGFANAVEGIQFFGEELTIEGQQLDGLVGSITISGQNHIVFKFTGPSKASIIISEAIPNDCEIENYSQPDWDFEEKDTDNVVNDATRLLAAAKTYLTRASHSSS